MDRGKKEDRMSAKKKDDNPSRCGFCLQPLIIVDRDDVRHEDGTPYGECAQALKNGARRCEEIGNGE